MSTTNGKNRIAESGVDGSDSTVHPAADNVAHAAGPKVPQRHVLKVAGEGERAILEHVRTDFVRAQAAYQAAVGAFCPAPGASYDIAGGYWFTVGS